MLDYDYIDKLSPKEKEFLSKFSTEYYSADFRSDKPLHKGKKARRKIYKTNNSRNQDMTAYLGNYGKLEVYHNLNDDDLKSKSPENALNAMIDLKKTKSVRK